jgi:hypothetical protein
VLSREAATIVRGRVVATDARWAAASRAIETVVTLEVEAALKGNAGTLVRFRVPGGVVGRSRQVIIGAPRFALEQRVIVFLAAVERDEPHLVGFSQGVYRVEPSPSGLQVTPPLVTASLSGRIVRGDPARRPLALGEFERQVRALVAGAR